ncbi:hypothetical protein JCM17380_32870 [Desulfosporosinus burensis]
MEYFPGGLAKIIGGVQYNLNKYTYLRSIIKLALSRLSKFDRG